MFCLYVDSIQKDQIIKDLNITLNCALIVVMVEFSGFQTMNYAIYVFFCQYEIFLGRFSVIQARLLSQSLSRNSLKTFPLSSKGLLQF